VEHQSKIRVANQACECVGFSRKNKNETAYPQDNEVAGEALEGR